VAIKNVQPGPADTEMNPDSDAFAEMSKGMEFLRRYGKANEIVGAAACPAIAAAGCFTGAGPLIDDGFAG
jgi:3-oxoacyl-[acyl-carrier protein] reductase